MAVRSELSLVVLFYEVVANDGAILTHDSAKSSHYLILRRAREYDIDSTASGVDFANRGIGLETNDN